MIMEIGAHQKRMSVGYMVEMKFLCKVEGHIKLDIIHNKNIRNVLLIFSLNKEIQDYRQMWMEHIQ
jgi:hypothetical protein